MAKVMTKAVKAGLKRKKPVTKVVWEDSSSSGSDSGEDSEGEGVAETSARKMMRDLSAEETLREMSTHFKPSDYTLGALAGHAQHWGEDFNTRRRENEDIRQEVMAMAKRVRGGKDTTKLAAKARS